MGINFNGINKPAIGSYAIQPTVNVPDITEDLQTVTWTGIQTGTRGNRPPMTQSLIPLIAKLGYISEVVPGQYVNNTLANEPIAEGGEATPDYYFFDTENDVLIAPSA